VPRAGRTARVVKRLPCATRGVGGRALRAAELNGDVPTSSSIAGPETGLS
jgi:hypothetical protein